MNTLLEKSVSDLIYKCDKQIWTAVIGIQHTFVW